MTRKRGVIVPLLMAVAGALAVTLSGQEAAKPVKPTVDKVTSQEGKAKPKRIEKSVSVSAVFPGDTKFLDSAKVACEDSQGDKLQECFANAMKKANATPAAVEFSKELGEPGFVRDFKVAGPVDIAYVFYPYRANENQSCLIVNGEPSPIDVDNHKVVASDALKGNAAYAALLRTHKEISLWPGDRYGTETPDVEMGVNAGAHIIVNYRLREQCHACAVLGHAWYAFEFDSTGKFGGAKLLGVSVAREPATLVRPSNSAVATAVGEELTIALPVKPGAGTQWMLSKALDTTKVRLIEHSQVAPPKENGATGTDELWKFAALGAGVTEIEFQKEGEKAVKFRIIARGQGTASGAKKPGAHN
jgi:predicted secreted protein